MTSIARSRTLVDEIRWRCYVNDIMPDLNVASVIFDPFYNQNDAFFTRSFCSGAKLKHRDICLPSFPYVRAG